MQTDVEGTRRSDRREKDRRKVQVSPLPFPDRRARDRRSGQDRRDSPRF